MELNIKYSSDEDIYRISVTDDILQMLEEHLVQLYSMKGSKYIISQFDEYPLLFVIFLSTKYFYFRYISIFFKEADHWSKGISLVTDVLEITLSVQRQLLYAMVGILAMLNNLYVYVFNFFYHHRTYLKVRIFVFKFQRKPMNLIY